MGKGKLADGAERIGKGNTTQVLTAIKGADADILAGCGKDHLGDLLTTVKGIIGNAALRQRDAAQRLGNVAGVVCVRFSAKDVAKRGHLGFPTFSQEGK